MNSITLVGNVAGEVELGYTAQGTAMAKFTLAENTFYDGEKATNWFGCTMFGKTAEAFAANAHVGAAIFVSGKLTPNAYLNKQNEVIVRNYITVSEWSFAGAKAAAKEEAPAPVATAPKAAYKAVKR